MKRIRVTFELPVSQYELLADCASDCQGVEVHAELVDSDMVPQRVQKKGQRTKGPTITKEVFAKIMAGNDMGYATSTVAKVRMCKTFSAYEQYREEQRLKAKEV